MRDLLRLIVVAAMSFAVVGIAMIYSRGGDLDGAFRAIGDGVAGLVQQVEGGDATEPAAVTGLYRLTLPRPNAAQWAGLAGFPDQAEVVFTLPWRQTLVSGVLDLGFDTQLAQHGDGLLTLSVNGTPRGQLVLDSGRSQHRIRLELSPSDLANRQIVLHMAGRGTTNSGQICPSDAVNSGSAITLTADSRLELQSSQPLDDAVEALVIAPRPLVLDPGKADGDMALAIWASQRFNRSGIAARIGQAGAGETPVGIALHLVQAAGMGDGGNQLAGQPAVEQVFAAAGSALPLPTAWPVGVADLGAETIVKSFRGSRRFVVPFNIADLPGGALPETFQLRLKTTPLAGSNDWVVRVSLNNNLLDTRRLSGASDTISFDVELPPTRMLPHNMLVVELVDTTPVEGTCARAPDAQAQLLPESVLLDSAPSTGGWAGLVQNLAAASDIGLVADTELSLAQADRASEIFSSLVSRRAEMRFDHSVKVQLVVVGRQGLARMLNTLPSQAGLLAVLPPALSGSGVQAPRVVGIPSAEFGAALEELGPDDVVILVSGL